MSHYLIRHKYGWHIAARSSSVFDGVPYRWTTIPSRALRLHEKADAERLAVELREEEPECGAEVIEEIDASKEHKGQ